MTPIIAIHGGFTHELRETPELIKAKQDSIAWILAQAEDYLYGRGEFEGQPHKAAETAEYAVSLLEKNPLFNAGLGAKHQMDGECRRSAAIMDGATRTSGAGYVVPGITAPIKLAAHLRRKAESLPPHQRTAASNANLSGREALNYALEDPELQAQGVSEEYISTPARLAELKRFRQERASQSNTGTVGCVVLDQDGHYAAATSTGGTVSNLPGRVGDSASPAGNFANERGAVSMTGWGEGILNLAMASGMVESLKYTDAAQACADKFREAHERHVGAGAIMIGQGKGDAEPQLLCTDSERAMVFGFARGDGKAHVFSNDLSTYYTQAELSQAGIEAEYIDYAKPDTIAHQRATHEVELTAETRQRLDEAVHTIMESPENRPVPYIPPGGVQRAKGMDLESVRDTGIGTER